MPGAAPSGSVDTPPLAPLKGKPCGFLSLPPEVRTIIYDLIRGKNDDDAYVFKRTLISLLRTSRQIYNDVVPYLYENFLVKLTLPKDMSADDRHKITLVCTRRLFLTICEPLDARETLALISGYIRECAALQEMIIDVKDIDKNEFGKLVFALLHIPYLASFPNSRFEVYVYANPIAGKEDRCSLNNYNVEEIPESEIRAQLPTTTTTKLKKIELQISLGPKECKTLMSRKLGQWHMVKTYERWGWVGGSIGLSWEKTRDALNNENEPDQEQFQPKPQSNFLSQMAADGWHDRATED